MSEFFLELFSEEIPAGLQKNLREKIFEDFKNLFEEKSIKSKKKILYLNDSNIKDEFIKFKQFYLDNEMVGDTLQVFMKTTFNIDLGDSQIIEESFKIIVN